MSSVLSRRDFLMRAATLAATPGLLRASTATAQVGAPLFRISLAQWSLHRTIGAGKLAHLDFAAFARREFSIDAIEYVNSFFKDRATDASYLAEMNRRAAGEGVTQHLIMCDGEGQLGDPDAALRTQAVDNHRKWIDAAHTLGCATIRVNAESAGTWDEQLKLVTDGLARLTALAAQADINVVVENHGQGKLSTNGQWLSAVMRAVNHPRCGTLPDFGNFYEYDRYQGVTDLMPFAKAVSAKSHDFDAAGNETTKDYRRLMRIVVDAGYHSWVGIEYEGERLSERDGIASTLRLLERVRAEMTHAPEGHYEYRPDPS